MQSRGHRGDCEWIRDVSRLSHGLGDETYILKVSAFCRVVRRSGATVSLWESAHFWQIHCDSSASVKRKISFALFTI